MLQLTWFLPAPSSLSAPAPPRNRLPDVLRFEPDVPHVLQLRPPVLHANDDALLSTPADAQLIRTVSSSKTKFYHAVAVLGLNPVLPQDVASQIFDLIRAPPSTEPYEVLRERLIKLYTLQDYQRFKAMVFLPLSGDQKPSHLMNRMLAHLLQRPTAHTFEIFLRLPLQSLRFEVSTGSGVSSSPRR